MTEKSEERDAGSGLIVDEQAGEEIRTGIGGGGIGGSTSGAGGVINGQRIGSEEAVAESEEAARDEAELVQEARDDAATAGEEER